MANRISQFALWGGSFTVAAATWTPNDFVGFLLVDALGGQRLITGNSATKVFYTETTKPQIGQVLTFTSPGWTANQFRSGQIVGGVPIQSLLIDDNGAAFTIAQNTTTSLVLPDGAAPVLAGNGAYILQGGTRQATIGAPTSTKNGFWQIVETDGTPVTDSDTDTGEVTAVEGGTTIPAAQPGYSQAIQLEGVESFSVIAGFLALAASSPVGTLTVYVSDVPGPNMGAQPGWNSPGPSPLDADAWVAIKTSKDSAAIAATVAIADAVPHMIVPSAHPNSPILYAQWLMLKWAPTSGAGNFRAAIFGYGPG